MDNFDKKIVVIGGGSGLSTLLKGLKRYPLDITAVVAVSDDGGSSGELRKLFQMTPPGDIRRVLTALSDEADLLNDLLNYRFNEQLDNHTVGNIMMAALYDMNNGSMGKSIEQLGKFLKIKGHVLPVSEDLYQLRAQYTDGSSMDGETNIVKQNKKISKIEAVGDVKANPNVIKAILEADYIIYSTGSLFTSLISNLVLPEIIEALKKAKAYKIYIANVMTQNGETNGYSLSDHVNSLVSVIGKEQLDYVLANDDVNVDSSIIEKYRLEQSELVYPDVNEVRQMGIEIETSRLIFIDNGMIRHNAHKVAATIAKKIIERS